MDDASRCVEKLLKVVRDLAFASERLFYSPKKSADASDDYDVERVHEAA